MRDDCPVLQSHGVHFSAAGKQFTAILTAAAILPYLAPGPDLDASVPEIMVI